MMGVVAAVVGDLGLGGFSTQRSEKTKHGLRSLYCMSSSKRVALKSKYEQ